jgi:hypothetical protein
METDENNSEEVKIVVAKEEPANDTEKQKASMEEFIVADGKQREKKEEEIKQVKELEDLLGIEQMNPFKTLDKDIFEQNLSSMSVSDISNMCQNVGLNPPPYVNQMKKALSTAFDLYARKHNVTVQGQAKPIIDKSSPDYDSVVRLFKD